jgi:hypothetical protein
MLAADLALRDWLGGLGAVYKDGKPFFGALSLELAAGAIGVVIVVALGKWLGRKASGAEGSAPPA